MGRCSAALPPAHLGKGIRTRARLPVVAGLLVCPGCAVPRAPRSLAGLMTPATDVKFCPRCATPLELKDEHGVLRPTCPACGYIHYHNPVPAAGVLLRTMSGLLMVRRR